VLRTLARSSAGPKFPRIGLQILGNMGARMSCWRNSGRE
jgi:hypothetical protein